MAATAILTPPARPLPGAPAGVAPGRVGDVRTDAADPLALRAPRRGELLRRLRLPLVAAVVLVAAALVSGVSLDPLVEVARRLLAADGGWLLAAAALEVGSFAGYVLLLWAVAGRHAPAFGLRAAYDTTVAGAAATRLLPTAGAGGAALTLWVLRRAGARDAARTLAAFLAVLYGVFLLAVLAAGLAVTLGGRPEIGALPAVLAAAAITVAVALGRAAGRARNSSSDRAPERKIPTDGVMAAKTRTDPPARGSRTGNPVARRVAGAVAHGVAALGPGIADAGRLVRGSRDPRLLGAVAWWGFDLAVLGAAVHAVGGSIALGTLALAYLLGQVANTVPLPGAASSGLVGVLVLLGLAAPTAVAAVLCYRIVAVWLPAPAGVVALARLRRTALGWRDGHTPQRLPA